MKENHEKCHLKLNTQEEKNIYIVNTIIKCFKAKKLLKIINQELKFDKHIENIIGKWAEN